MLVEGPGHKSTPSRRATGAECAAIKSPTIFDQASMTSVSRKRSRSPKRCINFGTSSVGDCQRSGRIFLSGKPRHSAITAERRDEFIKSYLATDEQRWNTDFKEGPRATRSCIG